MLYPFEMNPAGETPLHTLAHGSSWCDAAPKQRKAAIQRLVEGGSFSKGVGPK